MRADTGPEDSECAGEPNVQRHAPASNEPITTSTNAALRTQGLMCSDDAAIAAND